MSSIFLQLWSLLLPTGFAAIEVVTLNAWCRQAEGAEINCPRLPADLKTGLVEPVESRVNRPLWKIERLPSCDEFPRSQRNRAPVAPITRRARISEQRVDIIREMPV
jgi:hypothetical protein